MKMCPDPLSKILNVQDVTPVSPIPALIEASKDEYVNVRKAAAEALKKIRAEE